MEWPVRRVALIVLLVLTGCAAITERLVLPPVTWTTEYPDGQHPMLVGSSSAEIYAAPDRESRLISVLPPAAVVWSTGEAGSDTRTVFYHIRTRSGDEGWCVRWAVAPITNDTAELAMLRDRQGFEKALQDTIFGAVARQISAESIHPASRVEGMWVVSGQDSVRSTTSHDVQVRAVMVGNILGRNKFQLDFKVNLFVALNRNHLSASTIESNRVTVLQDTTIAEMPLPEVVNLLKMFGAVP